MRVSKQVRLTRERLLEVLNYEPETGIFRWKVRTNPRSVIGEPAGCVDSAGYSRIMIDRELFHGHRLAWFYVNNEWPREQITHINGDYADNRIANLILVKSEFVGSGIPLSVERLKRLMKYDPETGEFTWLVSTSKRAPVGSLAGSVPNIGYRYIAIDGKKYLAHRLAWFYTHGEWPPNQIDHINGNRLDNRLVNLRMATNAENSKNCGPRSTNTSGYKGVSFVKDKGLWTARIYADYHLYVLGYFSTREAATVAYNEAAKRLHGEFANFTEVTKAGTIEDIAENYANLLK